MTDTPIGGGDVPGDLPGEAAAGLWVPDWLARRADVSGDRLALIAPGVRWTFAELDRAADRMAAWLATRGVGAGDRVAVLLGNGAPMVALVPGAPRVGAILVPLNLRLRPAELGWQIAHVGARLLVHDEPSAALARAATADLPSLPLAAVESCPLDLTTPDRLTSRLPLALGRERGPGGEGIPGPGGEGVSGSGGERRSERRLNLGAVATVVYTSGTTGRPKGAMLTFGNHWWSAVGSALNLGVHEDDRWLAVLPLFHVGGLSILVRSVVYGITAVVQARFEPAEANRVIDEEGVTTVSVVSAMLQRMLDERGPRPYPPSLRCVLLGGGPAPRPLLEACAERGVPVVQTYGLTETASQVATLAPADALRKLGSAGKALLPAELRVVKRGREAAPGEVGEIVVRGPSLAIGYVNCPDETAKAIRDGWLQTGDLGYLDDEGYLYVVDRRDDLIISGGENVYPAEVEASLLAHPDVAQAGVRGVPDERWGQVVGAVVVLRPGSAPTADQLRAFCRERLAGYKVPAVIRFAESLPRNAAGKLLRRTLPIT
jgi:O-succinylbenzoic acid--CoA ligase